MPVVQALEDIACVASESGSGLRLWDLMVQGFFRASFGRDTSNAGLHEP